MSVKKYEVEIKLPDGTFNRFSIFAKDEGEAATIIRQITNGTANAYKAVTRCADGTWEQFSFFAEDKVAAASVIRKKASTLAKKYSVAVKRFDGAYDRFMIFATNETVAASIIRQKIEDAGLSKYYQLNDYSVTEDDQEEVSVTSGLCEDHGEEHQGRRD